MNSKAILLAGLVALSPAGAALAQQPAQSNGQPPNGHGSNYQQQTVNPGELGSPGMQEGGGYPQQPNYGPTSFEVRRAWGSPMNACAARGQPGTGWNNGLTPVSRMPNCNSMQSATPAGGRQNTPIVDQAHRS